LRDRIIGRVSLEKIKDYEGKVIVDINERSPKTSPAPSSRQVSNA
jgi:hypothetical protein